MNRDAYESNLHQLEQKRQRAIQTRKEMEEEYQRTLENIRGSELLTAYEKEQKIEQAKEYFQALERQLKEKNLINGYNKMNVKRA